MSAVIAVILGAAIGAPARAALERIINQRVDPTGFPLALSIINISGSFIAGAAYALTEGDLRVFLMVGIAGSFTTFSGWVQVISQNHPLRGGRTAGERVRALTWMVGIGAGVMGLCVAAAWLGMNLG